eukprot:gb/GEZN01009240.1/.p1 GENE.gb/GEZN01009240.1/~~gb/GEZN01009240.1/.p1  ORF type:complete len:106 (+),score=0.90 gb/GEZN01009240.1/:31-348(+)
MHKQLCPQPSVVNKIGEAHKRVALKASALRNVWHLAHHRILRNEVRMRATFEASRSHMSGVLHVIAKRETRNLHTLDNSYRVASLGDHTTKTRRQWRINPRIVGK